MPRLPQPGGDSGNWGTILNEYLTQSHTSDGTLKDNTVGTAQLQDNAVTASTIADNAVTTSALAPDAVTNAEIADGTIQEAQLANGVQTKLNQTAPTWSTISGKPAVIAAGDDAAAARSAIGAPSVDDPRFDETSDTGVASLIADPASETKEALDGRYASKWVADTAYTADVNVLLPNSKIGTRTTAGTSRPSFDATEEAEWITAPVLPTGGTEGQVPIKGSGTSIAWGAPTSTDAVARKRNVTAQRRAMPGVVTRMPLPATFNWLDAPIRIFKDGARYVTDFDVARFKNVSGKSVYFDHIVGLSANDGLTEATPKKTLQECINLANDKDTIVALSKGVYHRQSSVITNRFRKNLNIIAKHPGELTFSYSDALTYTQDVTSTSVYTATRSNVAKVIDLKVGDSGGFEYTKVATISECQAQPGSWYQSDTIVGIHTFDGTAPSNDQHIALLRGELFYCDATTQDVTLYMEGFTILGGNNGNLTIDPQSTYWADVYCKNVDFFWATGLADAVLGNSVNIQGARYAFFQSCRSAHSSKDGFNYTKYNVAQEEKSITRFIEVNCESWDHGIGNGGSANTHNASSAHAGCRGIRLGGKYHHTYGAIVADVQADTKSINYSCMAFDSLSTTTDGYNSAFCIQQVGAEMWLFDCTAFGTSYDIFTTTTEPLHVTDTQFDTRLVNAAYDIVNPL